MQVVAVSHKWARQNHPDPDGSKLAALRAELTSYRGTNTGVFVDFYCLKQHNTFEDDAGTVITVVRNDGEEKEVRLAYVPHSCSCSCFCWCSSAGTSNR